MGGNDEDYWTVVQYGLVDRAAVTDSEAAFCCGSATAFILKFMGKSAPSRMTRF
jgi:hypothetical protein